MEIPKFSRFRLQAFLKTDNLNWKKRGLPVIEVKNIFLDHEIVISEKDRFKKSKNFVDLKWSTFKV